MASKQPLRKAQPSYQPELQLWAELDVSSETELLHAVSYFTLNGASAGEELRTFLADDEDVAARFLSLADLHHVLLRTLQDQPATLEIASRQRGRNLAVVRRIAQICSELETAGCPSMTIKSLDHWPDLGHDFDLFTNGPEREVLRIMQQRFEAEVCPQSWSERLANKWNFRVPGLEPLVETHVSRLGQVGELTGLGAGLLARRQVKKFGDVLLPVPSREDQVILSALQRLYRHFFYRVCDFVDTAEAVKDSLEFEQLRAISKQIGLWGGVATHLRIVSEYVDHYTGRPLRLPAFVRKAAKFGIERIYPHAGYLRLPLFPHGAKLYGHQVMKNLKRGNHAGAARLTLLPPLAAAAGVAFKFGGKRNGVW